MRGDKYPCPKCKGKESLVDGGACGCRFCECGYIHPCISYPIDDDPIKYKPKGYFIQREKNMQCPTCNQEVILNPKSCKHCGSYACNTRAKYDAFYSTGGMKHERLKDGYRYYCGSNIDCRHSGPYKVSEIEALKAWNDQN